MIHFPKRCMLERTSDAKDLPVPTRQTMYSSGVDLHAKINDKVTLKKGECVLIPVGIKIALPLHYEAQIRSRSGLAMNHGVVVLNSPGTIDADYRGEIKVLLINHGVEDFIISRGDRIAQMIIAKVEHLEFYETDTLSDTERGEAGLGSTGVTATPPSLPPSPPRPASPGMDKDAFEEFKRKKAEELLGVNKRQET